MDATASRRAIGRNPFGRSHVGEIEMGRLSTIPSRLGLVPPALASVPIDTASRDRERRQFHPYRDWYKTAEWQALRAQTLLRDLYTCQMCGQVGGKLVCDHRRPHRGNRSLFFDPSNTQTLCHSPCHAKHKQRLEQAQEYR